MRRVEGQQPSSSCSTAGSTRSFPLHRGGPVFQKCQDWSELWNLREPPLREGLASSGGWSSCPGGLFQVGGGSGEAPGRRAVGAGVGRAPAVNTGVGAQRWGPIPRGWRGRLLEGNPKQLPSDLLLHFLGVFCVSGPVFDRHSSSVLLERGGDVTFKTLAIWGLSCGIEWLQSAGLSCSQSCGILVHWPGLKPTSPALQGKLSTTGPPGKSPGMLLKKNKNNLFAYVR